MSASCSTRTATACRSRATTTAFARARTSSARPIRREAGATGVFEAKSTSSAKALGIEGMAANGVQGRGVMIDLNRDGDERRAVIGYDALMRTIERDKVEIETGDLVCLHTGYADLLLRNYGHVDHELAHNRCAVLNGRDRRLLQWITDSGLSALIADNFAVESFPGGRAHRLLRRRAAARALPVQARRASRRALASDAPRPMAEGGGADQVHADRAAAAAARRDRVSRHPDRNRLSFRSPDEDEGPHAETANPNTIPASAPKNLEFIKYEKKGNVAYVTINRPEVRNALHSFAYIELRSCWRDIGLDPDIYVGILTGTGPGLLRRARREVPGRSIAPRASGRRTRTRTAPTIIGAAADSRRT